MAFASFGGNRNWQKGIKILTELATDERRYVWRSVASALLYLARRHPEVQNMLKEWLQDPKRANVAKTALAYLVAKKKYSAVNHILNYTRYRDDQRCV